MSNSIVLTEKLRCPVGGGLRRARLLEHFRPAEVGLGLVVAPAGSGKTTLLAQIAAAESGPVAWYRTDGNDRDGTTFLAHLARVLTDALEVPIAHASLPHLLASLPAVLDRPGTESGGGALLVLDDLQEIAVSPAERLVEQLIVLRPPWLRILVGSRRIPEVNVPRLRVSDAVVEVTADDLRWRSWEVEELFLSHFREPLSPEAAAALTRRTGGWVAGLQLFHLSTTRRPVAERHRAVQELGGRSKLIRSYLASNVLSGLTPERQNFLRRTCALEPLTADLCDGLLGTRGSAAVLEELEQQQLFTVSDDDGETYHYHEVLRSHLQWSLVQHEGPDAARGWYRRSARLLEQVGAVRGAIGAAVQAEDWATVARLVRTAPLTGGHRADAVDGEGPLLPLPSSVVAQDPWLSLAQARRLLRSGATAPAVDAFRSAEQLLDEPGFRAICRRERAVAQLWAGAASASGWLSLDIRPATAHWSARLREATMRLPSDGGPGSTTDAGASRTAADHLVDALVRVLSGDLGGARTSLRAADAATASPGTGTGTDPEGGPGDPVVALVVALATVVVDLLIDPTSEVPHPAAAALIEIAAAADDVGQPWIARLARGLREAALVSRDDVDGQSSWRRQACADAVEVCDRLEDPWGAAVLQVASAAVAADRESARRAYAGAAARFRTIGAPVVALWIDALLGTCHPVSAAPTPPSDQSAGRPAAVARMLQGARAMQVPAVIDLLAAGPPRSGPVRTVRIVDVVARHLLLPAGPSVTPGRTGRTDDRRQPSADAVRVRCFGGFALTVGDQPVDLTPLRPRARSLLRLLALHSDEDQHRERLVDAMWPGVDLLTGGRRLQVAVSAVRQVLERAGLSGTEVLRRRDSAYRLMLPAGSEVDVHRFADDLRRAATATGPGADEVAITARHAALARYTGDLLPEDGPADWVVEERDRLRLLAAGAATRLAEDLRRTGRPGPAVDAARRAIALDRFTDPAWELLVELLASTGDASGAAHAQREHRRVQEELDLIG